MIWGLEALLVYLRDTSAQTSMHAATHKSHIKPVVSSSHHLVGLVVKASASRVEDIGFESRLRGDFFGVESYL